MTLIKQRMMNESGLLIIAGLLKSYTPILHQNGRINVPKKSHTFTDSNIIGYLFCDSICFESDILAMMTTCIGEIGGSILHPSSELDPPTVIWVRLLLPGCSASASLWWIFGETAAIGGKPEIKVHTI